MPHSFISHSCRSCALLRNPLWENPLEIWVHLFLVFIKGFELFEYRFIYCLGNVARTSRNGSRWASCFFCHLWIFLCLCTYIVLCCVAKSRTLENIRIYCAAEWNDCYLISRTFGETGNLICFHIDIERFIWLDRIYNIVWQGTMFLAMFNMCRHFYKQSCYIGRYFVWNRSCRFLCVFTLLDIKIN